MRGSTFRIFSFFDHAAFHPRRARRSARPLARPLKNDSPSTQLSASSFCECTRHVPLPRVSGISREEGRDPGSLTMPLRCSSCVRGQRDRKMRTMTSSPYITENIVNLLPCNARILRSNEDCINRSAFSICGEVRSTVRTQTILSTCELALQRIVQNAHDSCRNVADVDA